MSALSPTVPAPGNPAHEQLMQQLMDIRLPEPYAFWPPSWHFWLIVAVVVLLLAVAVYLCWRQYARSYRRHALQLLDGLESQISAVPDEMLMTQINTVLKRACFSAYPHERRAIAPLHTHDWLRFLRSRLPPRQQQRVSDTAIENWVDLGYRSGGAREDGDIKSFLDFSRHWVKRHKRGAHGV